MGDSERSAKRQKTKNWGGGGGKDKPGDKSKYRAQAAHARGKANISATGLQSGDVGIFVTSDKGKEKACLREMEDLLSDELDLADAPDTEAPPATEQLESGVTTTRDKPEDGGIEDDIEKELADLAGEGVVGEKRKRSAQNGGNADSSANKRKIGLVTLDIPCVSFVRFPSQAARDPANVAAKMCRDARAHPEQQRSRFIKRLTPLSKVRKVMSGGVEELCQDVLPAVFGGDERWKYAVRVTVRNNNKIEKDQVIKTVAGAVREMGLIEEGGGESKHSVSLKGYDKLVLVEIYRNVVGMSVVGAEWESLRRFNLSEIYAEGRASADKSAKAEQATLKESLVESAQETVAPQEHAAETLAE